MYEIIILPLFAGFLAQVFKFLIHPNKLKWDVKNLAAYSGMPSGHSAITVSLSTIVGLTQGFDSAVFGICFVLMILIIRDALGLRRYLGQHGKVLNILVKDLDDDSILDHKYPHLLEKIGHTPEQVIAGSALGFLVSLIGYFILY